VLSITRVIWHILMNLRLIVRSVML
jgi:hypothetical protein